jgi:LAO/AO transport system kinase
MDWEQLSIDISTGNCQALSRAISLVINQYNGYEQLLAGENDVAVTPVIGITGPPGAGKSTLLDGLISELIRDGHSIAVLCVDPSSAFTRGAILGDRIRMRGWYNNPQVYIRSLATRGQLGGLPPMIKEIIELVRNGAFDYIFVETVGVGQNEVGIASLADVTVVVLVPEGGDEIQVMKAGLMEIADIFVVNKSDKPGAEDLYNHLRAINRDNVGSVKVVRTVASSRQGMRELVSAINSFTEENED